MNEFPELKSDCMRFLNNCDHVSLRAHTLEIMRRMYAHLQEYFREHPQDLEPPTLGISVKETIQTSEKLR